MFYKLFLSNVHKNGDLKQKPSKCGSWQKQVMEIQIKYMNKLSDLLAPIWNKSRQITPQNIKIKWLSLENEEAKYDNRIYCHAYNTF